MIKDTRSSSTLVLQIRDHTADAMFEVSQPPPKSIRELEETGLCLDHIVAGMSAIPLETGETNDEGRTLGRGAIAAEGGGCAPL